MTLGKPGAIGQDPPVDPQPRSFNGCRVLLLLAGAFVVFLLAVGPNFLMAKPLGKLTACKSNCKNLATALEMYAGSNGGAYPTAMSALTAGGYLKTIPTCHESNTDTYSGSYRVAKG